MPCVHKIFSVNQKAGVASESLLPPEGPPAALFNHKQLICSLHIIPVSLAAPSPDPYMLAWF